MKRTLQCVSGLFENVRTALTLKKTRTEFEGSGIFTVGGRELPKINGGYDLVQTSSGLGHNAFIDK